MTICIEQQQACLLEEATFTCITQGTALFWRNEEFEEKTMHYKSPADTLTPEPPRLSSVATVSLPSGTTRAPNNATQGDQTAHPATLCPSPIQCDKRESCTKNPSDSEKGQQWTQVTGRKRRKACLPPY